MELCNKCTVPQIKGILVHNQRVPRCPRMRVPALIAVLISTRMCIAGFPVRPATPKATWLWLVCRTAVPSLNEAEESAHDMPASCHRQVFKLRHPLTSLCATKTVPRLSLPFS